LPPEGFPKPKERYVLTVSRVDARKNHLRMLEAFERAIEQSHLFPAVGQQEVPRCVVRFASYRLFQWFLSRIVFPGSDKGNTIKEVIAGRPALSRLAGFNRSAREHAFQFRALPNKHRRR
jgi:glycosyltransferase involved in cell wall biosynthesis